MPKTKSAKKKLRQEAKRRKQNLAKKEAYKTIKRQIKKALPQGGERLLELIKAFQKAVDKGAKTGAIHKNKAAREKAKVIALVKRANLSVEAKASGKKARAKVQKATRSKASSHKAK